eukprot:CAMPEP_0204843978 /NCGR_PEP_ID=MMETSP1346-20131115/48292_1 /ASSEMBLY_ACC=CAM_ASM_000771 /TAXON_ID=215587 /ORGANISM="Aplanochytrium stocchinoi, Strain GSBS06" /LENGTH=1136 /DNA_ID=CAMNT_0051983205 /DNA_START=92 /DNA_END=3502 /DNA_ORIENTATION=-
MSSSNAKKTPPPGAGAKMVAQKGFEDDAYAMDRYSRQIGTYGVEAMARLVKMKVLVLGLKGVGIEAAKNLILAGPGAVTLYDDDIVTISDLGTNFYLSESHVGKSSVAEASLPALKSLNPLVNVTVHTGKLTTKLFSSHTIVVDCSLAMNEAKKWNGFCRKQKPPVGYIKSHIHGLVGYAFVDLGSKFSVRDKNGEQPITRIIDNIDTESENKNEIHVFLLPPPDGRMHNLEENKHEGWVKFEELEGELGEALNDQGPFEIKFAQKENSKGKTVFDPYSLRVLIPNRSKLPKYSGGGTIIQVKKPVEMTFNSLEAMVDQPIHPDEGMLLFTDGAKFGRADQLHMALCGLWAYEAKHDGQLPPANDDAAVEEILNLAIENNKKAKSDTKKHSVEELDADVVKMLAAYAECRFQPLACFFGGVVAQEVVKMTGKFTPLHQWVHIDAFEVLPEILVDFEGNPEAVKVSKEDRTPIGSRYDDLIKILGRPLHTKLMLSKTFMVGCGALGCEMLKNFALLGVACDASGEGLVTVTDNDNIEVSNLSRQFLFREDNVGQSKSVAATTAIQVMNPDIKVKAMETLVSPDTETIFTNQFWESQDFITNALDNVKARVYVDGKCVFYEKPLLESGTLGTKCNSQVIIPHMTASYSDGPNDDESGDAIPMCTLRNFPSQIEHCIEWGRAQFEDLFSASAKQASNYLKDPEAWTKELRAKTLDLDSESAMLSAVSKEMTELKEVYRIIMRATSKDCNFESCVQEAYNEFHKVYRDKIDALIALYPQDTVDKDGNLFWSGTKRFPQSATFNVDNPIHMNYVLNMANLLAVNYGLRRTGKAVPLDHPWRSSSTVKGIIATLSPPEPVKEKVDLSGGGEELEDGDKGKEGEGADDVNEEITAFENLLKELERISSNLGGVTVEAADFEKDDDLNFHIDFITAASNMRAWNYRLKEVSRHKCKMIAGKIIPAIATTTASVTGLVTIELLKLMQPGKKIEAFKDSSNSLGINGYFFSEPPPPIKAKDEYDVMLLEDVVCRPEGFTKWDKTIIKGDKSMSLAGFREAFKAETGLNCVTLLHSSANVPGSKGHSTFLYDEPESRGEEYMQTPLVETIADIYGGDVLGKTYIKLDCSCQDDTEAYYKIPEIVFHY